MNKLKVFSQKLGAALNLEENLVVCGDAGLNMMLSASWTNEG